jgi:ABC-2 type transport system permease protein
MNRALVISRMTVRQTLGVKRFVGLGILTIAPAGIFFLASRQQIGREIVETFVGISIGVFYNIALPVVALIMAASALGDERRDATLSFIILRPISRFVVAGAKLGGALVTALGLSGVGGLALGVLMGIRSGDWGYVVPTLLATLIATAIYVSLFLPLGYVTERATLIGLGFVFIWESAIAGTIPGLAGTSPWRVGFSAFVDLAPEATILEVPDFALGDLTVSATGSLLRMAIIFTVSLLATGWILQKRDLV